MTDTCLMKRKVSLKCGNRHVVEGENIVKSKKEDISSVVCGPNFGPLDNNKYLSASYPPLPMLGPNMSCS